jgi:acyl-CoA synthetase (AMP-forming)/AMP-acid ligase II
MSRPDSVAPQRIWHLVAWRAGQTPDRVLVRDDRGRALSAVEFRDAAERVAAGLAALGVGAGTRVMWQLPTTVESVVLSMALARLGATQNPLIAMLREAEIRALDEQFQPEFAVVPTQWRGFAHADAVRAIAGSRVRVVLSDHAEVAGDGLALPQGDPSTLPPPPEQDAPRWVYVTSGSTARPKGVRHTDASAFASSNAMVDQFGVSPDDVFPMAYPYAHIGGIAWLVTALRVGCRLVLLDSFDPVASPVTMAQHGATVLGSATPFFRAYLAAQHTHGDRPLFPALRLCMGGGAPVSPDLDETVRATLGGDGVVNGYGLTEFPIAGYPRMSDAAGKATSSWLPGPGVEVRVVGPDDSDLPPGQSGELRLRGPQRFAGYLESELDAATFDEQGYVRTGDLAVRDASGLVTMTGRLKEIVVRNGENISVAEVEAVLATHPAVADIAVVGLPDERLGELCCAVVAPVSGTEPPTLDDLAAHCRAAGLARYKTPERLAVLPAIPRNAMGKIQRSEVHAAIAQSDVLVREGGASPVLGGV